MTYARARAHAATQCEGVGDEPHDGICDSVTEAIREVLADAAKVASCGRLPCSLCARHARRILALADRPVPSSPPKEPTHG